MCCQTPHLIRLMIVLLVTLLSSTAAHSGEIEAGNREAMPKIHWTDDKGKPHQLSDSSGKPRLLHFWAAWCIPCREEMPQLLRWRKAHTDIDVILLSLDDRLTQSNHFINKNQFDMSARILNPDDADTLGINIVPYTVFVSSDGLFFGQIFGMGDWDDDQFTDSVYQQFGLTPASISTESQ